MIEGKDRLADLRGRVDRASRRLAELTASVESLERELEEAQRAAQRAEAELAEAQKEREGFVDLVQRYAGATLEGLPFLFMALPVLACVLGLVDCLVDEDAPYELSVMGSALESDVREAPPGARCDVTVHARDEDATGRCRMVLRCDAVVFDGEVACRMDERTRVDDEGDTVSYDVLVVSEDLPGGGKIALDEGAGTADFRGGPEQRSLHVIFHRWSSDGAL